LAFTFPDIGSCQHGSHSSAAFGIKSQAPANSALFNQNNSAKPQQSSLFGATQPSTSGFNALSNTSQAQPPTQSSSLFGTGTGVFGQNQQQQQIQPATTGTFGQPAGQQQPASTGIFGQPAGGTQQQPQQNAFGSSLFGSSTNQPNQQPGQSTFGGWGSTMTAANPLQPQATLPAGSSIFAPQQQRQQTYVTSVPCRYLPSNWIFVGLSALGNVLLCCTIMRLMFEIVSE
jgi:nucleoporin p58/p45